ncbi:MULTISPECIES: quorum-sensing system DWW-type pheromone [Streptococcus]|uniref:Quorum-sensing system DWW-type pheromone n=1 Tax=Streptococcus caledonicus TaxID=2614158 RepID=A0ABW0UED4_9STRE
MSKYKFYLFTTTLFIANIIALCGDIDWWRIG